MDSCIKRRLLLACGATYSHIHDPRPVGWIGEPVRVAGAAVALNGIPIDLALVGRIAEGVVVAFRGTLPPVGSEHRLAEVLADWTNNAAALCQPMDPWPGRVHRGFADSVRRLWDEGTPGLEAAVTAALAEGGPRRLLVTGHSKGGALANLFAWRAVRTSSETRIDVVTFAAARAGNQEFADAFAADPAIHCIRYEGALDMVPYLPMGWDQPERFKSLVRRVWPALLHGDYRPVGTRIASSLSWADWRKRKAAEIRAVFAGGFNSRAWRHELIEAHLIGPKTDYDAFVCDGESGCRHEL
ncbi:lipase family protein [Sphingomonas sp. AOB5]|uniref:lipase family protein n=1 Tax=Sphingomonas sp. AOB5 TaxID=3034017 RepID=UPI0023F66EDC|nr:lipase family protein [Sphingomonas sp. AOB5]MDF7777418.1 lipase family protein [Sphingomonas sp. AOB5]